MKKLVIVTGGSNGLGKQIVIQSLKQGHEVISLSRSLVKDIKEKSFSQYKLDFSKTTDKKVKSILTKINFKKYDQVCLVNNAAVIEPIDQVSKFKDTDIYKHVAVNLSGPISVTNSFLSVLNQKKIKNEKLVIQITSGAANRPIDGWSLYCATKAGLNMFSQVLAVQCAQDTQFKVIGYSPGVMDTKMQKSIRSKKQNQFPDVQDFKDYKNQNVLKPVDYVVNDLMDVISDFKSLKSGEIYRIR